VRFGLLREGMILAQDLTPDTILRSLFKTTMDAAHPAKLIGPEIFSPPPRGRTIVIGSGG